MNISFFDGVNDGKFYSINAGKYDELGEEDIDISEGVNEEIEDEDSDTCLNRFTALEKDASKLHMDLNNLRNEFKGSCKDWNNLSDTVDHMLNSIAELRTMMDKVNDRVNNRFKVVSEATAELADKLNLVEKKLEVFNGLPCEDCECPGLKELKEKITELEGNDFGDFEHMEKIDKELSTHLAMINKANMRLNQLDNKISDLKEFRDETYELQYGQLLDRLNLIEKKIDAFKCIDILDRLGKLEAESISQKIYSGRLSERIDRIEKKVNENLDWNDLTGTGTAAFESNKNDIQDDPVNHPKHYTDGKYECIDFIHQYGLGFDLGNAVKYITRAGIKSENTYIQDLEKALWYLEHHIKDPINPVVFSKHNMIPVDDYCHDKILTDELTRVIEDIVNDDIGTAAWILTKYIQGLKNEQSK